MLPDRPCKIRADPKFLPEFWRSLIADFRNIGFGLMFYHVEQIFSVRVARTLRWSALIHALIALQIRAEMIYQGFNFIPFVLLGSEFDSFSVFRFGSFLF